MKIAKNPYTPGAGHPPPFLAGRSSEIQEFQNLLGQDVITKNVIVTGLRGVGKTVLMDRYKPEAEALNWVWVGTELNESAFVSELAVCTRVIADLAFFTSSLRMTVDSTPLGFARDSEKSQVAPLQFPELYRFFDAQAGLLSDKLKATLEMVWPTIERSKKRGIIFAYDEAQVVADRQDKDEYPLALMLGLFQSLQKKGMRYMLALSGLPTLFSKLVASRTYSERMFTVQEVTKLSDDDSRKAITEPLKTSQVKFSEASVEKIIQLSGGYPYFIQFICRECFDHFKLQLEASPGTKPAVPVETIIAKLDSDFFEGRWALTTDRQRDLLFAVSHIPLSAGEFSLADIEGVMPQIQDKVNPFKKSDIAQMLPKLIEKGLAYKNRHGRYSLAIPLFSDFIQRQYSHFMGSKV